MKFLIMQLPPPTSYFLSLLGENVLLSTSVLKLLPSVVGFEVATPVIMKTFIFWNITPCSPFKVSRRSGGTQYTIMKQVATCFMLLSFFFDPKHGGDMFFRNVS
jgi:hypothetical protein